MTAGYKNKTLATLLASTLGGTGLHRFYLQGSRDRWAWLHAVSLPLSAIALIAGKRMDPVYSLFLFAPLIFSVLAGLVEALILGLTPDDKWNARYNAISEKKAKSSWPLALILVLTLAIGMGGLIFIISRTADLLFTGGSYG